MRFCEHIAWFTTTAVLPLGGNERAGGIWPRGGGSECWLPSVDRYVGILTVEF